MVKTKHSLLFCLSLVTQIAWTQITPSCPIPPPPAAESCSSTCTYCDLDGYTGTNNGTPSGGNQICGQIAVHNDHWFGFTAGSQNITITVLPSNCQNGTGLQTAIFEDCNALDALVCNPGSGISYEPLVLTYTNFIVGKTYYLMIDGWSGDICDYEIDITDGSIQAPIPGNPGPIQGPSLVCPGAFAQYRVEEVFGAGNYQWTAPPGSSINGMGSSVLLPAPEGANVNVLFATAGGTVCVQADNACASPSNTVCMTVSTQPLPPTILAPVVVCAEDLPYTWTEEPYPSLVTPGVYMFTSMPYVSYLGCDSMVRQTITIKAPIFTQLDTIFLCQGQCVTIGNTQYCSPGVYAVGLDSWQGCDSTLIVRIATIDPSSNANILAPQGQTLTCLQNSLNLLGSAFPNLSHLWKNSAGDTLSNAPFITINTAGNYTYQVTASQGGLTCSETKKILIKQNNTPPPVTAMGGTLDATHPTVQLKGNTIISGCTYLWTGPNGFTSTLQKPIVSVPGIYTLKVTNPQTGCSTTVTVEVTSMS